MPNLTPEEIRSVTRALRRPVGRYSYTRASQLSGIPQRTLHHWANIGVFVPDFDDDNPKQWSYRDLVLVRLFVWLRSHRFDPRASSARVVDVRQKLASGKLDPEVSLRSIDRGLFIGKDTVDPFTGAAPFETMLSFLDTFDLLSVASDFDGEVPSDLAKVSGPHLVRPSKHTAISPWVYGGEPCIRNTRLPTATVWALHAEQGLDDGQIAKLYPGVGAAQIRDAMGFEGRIRGMTDSVAA